MRYCLRCGGGFRGGTLLCASCQQEALNQIAREYGGDPEGTDEEARTALFHNLTTEAEDVDDSLS